MIVGPRLGHARKFDDSIPAVFANVLFASRAFTWQPDIVARETTEPWVQLATRIPKPVHRELKLRCVRMETSVMAFVVAAIEEKLAREGRRQRVARNS